ncbi:MAG: YdjY domain-containing protein [Planctomycetota bacterium]
MSWLRHASAPAVLSIAMLVGGCASDRSQPLRIDPVVVEPRPVSEPQAQAAEAAPTSTTVRTPDPSWASPFPGIRIDTARQVVEFEARVSPLIDPSGEDTTFYLEQIVCLAGTKDHESLLITDVRPSHVHASLLLIGLEPGAPVTWAYPGGTPTMQAPTGPTLSVELFVTDDEDRTTPLPPTHWAVERETGRPFDVGGTWVFAGSTERSTAGRTFYEADAAGTLLGLASFGSETIAFSAPISHEEDDGQLRWVADEAAMPAPDTRVVVRLAPAM